MSTAALAWALKQPIRPSSLKFLLVACADVTPEGGLTYPSVKHLCSITCQDDKTVYKGLQTLVERGFLKDTGKRTGRTQQITVYELIGYLPNTPENGSVSDGQRHPKFPSKTPVPPSERHPKTGDGTLKEELQEERLTRFNEFWEGYPRKVGKTAAEKIWKRKKLDSLADRLIQDVAFRVQNDAAWADKKYQPHASTYLNNDRWTDEIQKFDDAKPKFTFKTDSPTILAACRERGIDTIGKTREELLRKLNVSQA